MSLFHLNDLDRFTGGARLKLIRFVSLSVNAVVIVIAVALAWCGIIPIWVAVLSWIASMFLSGYAALLILRLVLGSGGFYVLTVSAQAERDEQEQQRKK